MSRFLSLPRHGRNLLWCLAVMVTVLVCGCGGSGSGAANPGGGTSPSGAKLLDLGGNPPVVVSHDGRYIAYVEKPNIVPNGMPPNTNQNPNIFRYDRISGEKILVSTDPTGTSAGDGFSNAAAISADGRYVLFSSQATNLVTGITPAYTSDNQVIPQLYFRDIQNGVTKIITVDSSGVAAANQVSGGHSISGNGQHVVFASGATNLVPGITYYGNTEIGNTNVFVRDLENNTTELISISADGTSAGKNGTVSVFDISNSSGPASISDDGRYVAFESLAWNLVDGVTYSPSEFDTTTNIFLRDRTTQTTQLLSVSTDGTQASNDYCSLQIFSGERKMSSDGSLVAFTSRATNLVPPEQLGADTGTNVFAWDRSIGHTNIISIANDGAAANDGSNIVAVSADGRYIALSSHATNLVSDDIGYYELGFTGQAVRSIYRWARATHTMEIVTLSTDGKTGPDFDMLFTALSDDGEVMVFSGSATNLTLSPAVTLTYSDEQDSIYRWDSTSKQIKLVSQSNGQSIGYANPSFVMSSDGNVVAFFSSISNLYLNAIQ